MKRQRLLKTMFAVASATAFGLVITMAEAVISPEQAAQASSEWQFYLDSVDGAQCGGCCFTGFCCDVPVVCSDKA